MRSIIIALALVSVPILMAIQMLQAYRYSITLEQMESYESLQIDRLEENKRLLAGIAVFSSPERVYSIAEAELGLIKANPGNILHVKFPNNGGGSN